MRGYERSVAPQASVLQCLSTVQRHRCQAHQRYCQSMAPRLENAAMRRVRADTPRFSDRTFIENELRERLAENFVREDKRQLIALPTVGPDGWIEQLQALFDLGVGGVSFAVDEVVEVRGDRLALYWTSVAWEHGESDRRLAVIQYDADVRLVEKYVTFDELDAALAALDEAARAIEG
jgi:hypothetical protein